MADTKPSFLAHRRYQSGEVERLQVLWDTAVEQLTAHLIPSVGETLRQQIATDVSNAWVASARAMLDSCLTSLPSAEIRDQAGSTMAAALGREFLSVGTPDDAAIATEIGATCRELSQRVLAPWFDILTRARRVGQAVPLNAVMLPEGLSRAKMVSDLDLDTYAATPLDVVAALSGYQRHLVAEFQSTREPIMFGTRLLVVPVTDQPLLPFQLFAEEGRAREAAALQSAIAIGAGAPALSPEARASYERVLAGGRHVIGKVMCPSLPATPPDFEQTLWTASRAAGVTPTGHPFDALVDLGLDAVCSGLAVGVETAEQHLRDQAGLITAALTAQAQDIGVSSTALHGVYTLTLQSALEARRPRSGSSNAAPGAFGVVQHQFHHAFGVSRGQAQTLAQTAVTSLRAHDGW